MEEENNKNEAKIKKEISNKKTIIAIISIVILIGICIFVYVNITKKEDECKNNYQQINYQQQGNSHTSFNPGPSGGVVDVKPIIYLYPQAETEVTVKVGNPQNLTHTYPKYENEWKVLAKPNGDLKDLKTGRNLYALYWEGINTVKPNMDEGFIVKGEDTIKSLEEKLEVLGLNEREAEEFIVYWLPKLESNKYNFIRFQTEEEINNNMPLEITPKPDTIIRILMEFKGLEEPIQIKEQKLITPQRTGFTVVEWGGTEIKQNVRNNPLKWEEDEYFEKERKQNGEF